MTSHFSAFQAWLRFDRDTVDRTTTLAEETVGDLHSAVMLQDMLLHSGKSGFIRYLGVDTVFELFELCIPHSFHEIGVRRDSSSSNGNTLPTEK